MYILSLISPYSNLAMITLQAYRAAIGLFVQKVRSSKTMCQRNNEATYSLKHYSFVYVLTFLCVFITFNMSFFKLTLLIKDGDIESNPGPPTYTILKSVLGSINQANIIFGETAGRQCVCNALYAIAGSTIRQITSWTTEDLDNILHKGDALYKSLGATGYLSLDEIPDLINISGTKLTVKKLGLHYGILSNFNSNSIVNIHKSEANKGNGFLIVFNGVTVSLLWNKAYLFLF